MQSPASEANPSSWTAADIQGIWGRRWRGLFGTVDGASLVVFRILFGLVMMVEVYRYFQTGWIHTYWIEPQYHFGYWPLDFLKPLPGNGMYYVWGALGVLAGMITIGLFYRVSCSLFWLGFTYCFLLEQARYLNHFYLVSLISFVLILVPAHWAGSVDSLIFKSIRSRTVPAWSLWWLRFMVGVPYFFGGLAKLNADWFHGEPLRLWLLGHTEIPIVGPLLAYDEVVIGIAWAGLLLDLLIVPALLFRRTRWLGLIAITLFHLVNAQLFKIGIFPWFMIAATALYFPPDWPRQIMNRLSRKRKMEPLPEDAAQSVPIALNGRQQLIFIGLAAWALLHIAVPLRHFFIPGNVHWTEEGHRYAWHMKLRSKKAIGTFWIADQPDAPRVVIHPEDYLTKFQTTAMMTKPYLIWQFAQIVHEDYALSHGRDIQVFADLSVSLNGRAYQQFTDPKVDLASVPRPWWPPTTWILPLNEK